MLILRFLLILLPVVAGSYSQSHELIRRVFNEGDSKATYFIAPEPAFVGTFMSVHSNAVPVITTTSGSVTRIHDVVILVVQDASAKQELLKRIIKCLRVRKYVVISARTKTHLHQLSTFFAKQKFSRIFGTANGTSYAFLTFANLLQPISSVEDPLPDATKDLNGYTIRTTAHTDVPRVFRYPDSRGTLQFGGLYAQIFLSFVETHNASFEEIPVTMSLGLRPWTLDFPAIWRAITEDRVELSVNNHAFVKDDYCISYPVHMQGWTLMIPINGYLDPHEYFLRPFTVRVWACIGATFLYIVVLDVLKDFAAGRVANPWRCFSRTLLIMLNMSADGLIGDMRRIHILIVVYAFVLTNLYLNHLTSFLTVFIRIKQYDTLREIVEHKVHFIVPDYVWEWANETGEFLQFLNIAHVVDTRTFVTQLNTMRNTSFSYTVARDKGEFLLEIQSLSAKPLFRLIRQNIGYVYTGFMIHPHSPLSESLTYFIMRSRETGLIEEWTRRTVWQGIKSGIRVGSEWSDDASAKPLLWNDLWFAWSVLAGGLGVALVAFVGEGLLGILDFFL